MSDFLNNTIFTNYAFKKLVTNLANDGLATYDYSPYNLITIKVGSGDNSADPSKIALSKSLYALNITDVQVSDKTITFTCEIPEDLEGVEITEIGLFDVQSGTENLFSYSTVSLIKPEDLGFKLVIELNLTLRTVNFAPNPIELVVNEYEMATQTQKNSLENAFLYLEANLERIIEFNAEETGRNLAQVYYEKEKTINNCLYGYSYANRYFNLLNKFGSDILNTFFIKDEDFLSYSINDMATDTAYVSVYSNKIESSGDSITFDDALTLSVVAKLGEYEVEIELDDSTTYDNHELVILNKIDSTGNYFILEMVNSNVLQFKLYGSSNVVASFTCTFDELDLKYLKDNYVNYTLTYNGNAKAPYFNLYIDGKAKEITQVLPNITQAKSMSAIPFKNYDPNSIAGILNLETMSVIALNREANADEVYFLYLDSKIRNTDN